jgi:predicted PurR-regulated permease PerM/methylmalonyl-CoA mutase cobalamin-binding subunit
MAQPLRASQTSWVLFAVIAVVAVLEFGEPVLMPLALAVLLAFLLSPIVDRLQDWGCNRVIAVVLTTVATCALAGGLLFVVAGQFLSLIDRLPAYKENLRTKIETLRGPGGSLDKSAEAVKELSEELQAAVPGAEKTPPVTQVQIVPPPPDAVTVIRGVFGPLLGPLGTGAIVVVLVIFMLVQRDDLRYRLIRLLGPGEMHTTVRAIEDAAGRVSRFLLMQTIINATQGVLVAAGLYFLGVPDALLWGALTIVLRFIPYLGPLLAAAGPIAISLAFFDSWTYPLLTVGLVVALELVSNNVLEPWLYGSSVGVSAFALILAAVFWTWLWGVPGLFLAIPLTVCLVVMGKYIPQLEFLSVLLGDEPVLEARERFYERLLSADPDGAGELLDEMREDKSPLEVCDTMLLPALRYVEQDHERGAVDEAKRRAIIDEIGALGDDVYEPDEPTAEADASRLAPGTKLVVLCLPAGDRADEVGAQLFAKALGTAGIEARTAAIAALKSEMLELGDRVRPDAICVSAVPPGALIHARYLCKRLRSRGVKVPVIVGLWDAQGDVQSATQRLASAGASRVVTSFAAATEEIGHLMQAVIQGVQKPDATEAVEERSQ